VRTTVANARANLIRAENNYAIAKARLNEAMGVTGGTDYDVADESFPPLSFENQSTEELYAMALDHRPELAAYDADIKAQKLTARQADRGMWPSLSLGADLSYSGTSFRDPGWGASIGVTLSWPLFDGYATRSNAKAEEIALVVLDAEKEALCQRLWLEIDDARLAVQSAKAETVAADEALASARELLRLAEERYLEGVGNIIELGDAQVAVTAAAAQKVQSEYDLAAARARLGRAVGV
jgi:outer membrane protein